MKSLLLITLITLSSSLGFAFDNLNQQIQHFQDLFNNPSSNTKISTSDIYNQGETRPKALLKGVFYFGGSDQNRKLLSNSFRENFCDDGFSRVYSVYKPVNTTISCSSDEIPYTKIGEASVSPSSGDKVYKLMKNIYDVIQSDGTKGAIYVHCHYGVHASNTIAQMVLKQFCDVSDDKAIQNWDIIDLYDSLPEERRQLQFKKIRNFEPYDEFSITASQKNKICY